MEGVENCHFIIKTLRLQNFRRFREAHFEFSPQMNVFIGKNASGKTSVLEVMTIIAGAYLSSLLFSLWKMESLLHWIKKSILLIQDGASRILLKILCRCLRLSTAKKNRKCFKQPKIF